MTRDVARMMADLAVASMVLWTWILFAAINTCMQARIEDMVAYAAWRPWVTRALVPAIVGILSALGPDLSRAASFPPLDGAVQAFSTPPVDGTNFPPTDPAVAILAILAMLPFVVIAIRAARSLLAREAPELPIAAQSLFAWGAALSLLALMWSPNFWGRPYYGMIYDPSTLGLMMLAVALLARESWSAYLVALMAAAVNRETAIFLIPVCALYAIRAGWSRRDLLSLVGLQLAIFGVVRSILELAAIGNATIAGLSAHPLAEFAVTTPTEAIAITIVVSISVLALCVSRRAFAPLSLLLPTTAAAYLFAGSPGEYRVFLEAVPSCVLATALVASWVSAKVSAGVQFAPRRVAT